MLSKASWNAIVDDGFDEPRPALLSARNFSDPNTIQWYICNDTKQHKTRPTNTSIGECVNYKKVDYTHTHTFSLADLQHQGSQGSITLKFLSMHQWFCRWMEGCRCRRWRLRDDDLNIIHPPRWYRETNAYHSIIVLLLYEYMNENALMPFGINFKRWTERRRRYTISELIISTSHSRMVCYTTRSRLH